MPSLRPAVITVDDNACRHATGTRASLKHYATRSQPSVTTSRATKMPTRTTRRRCGNCAKTLRAWKTICRMSGQSRQRRRRSGTKRKATRRQMLQGQCSWKWICERSARRRRRRLQWQRRRCKRCNRCCLSASKVLKLGIFSFVVIGVQCSLESVHA